MKAGKLWHRVTRTRVKGCKLPEIDRVQRPRLDQESPGSPPVAFGSSPGGATPGERSPRFSLGLGLSARAQEGATESAASDSPVAALSLFVALCELLCEFLF